MKMKKFIAVLSIASMMAVTAVGCGSSSSADTSSDNGSDTASEWMQRVRSQSYPVRKVQEQEERSQSCSVSLMRMTTI